MKITYTGRQVELAPAQLRKVEARFAKLAKLLDGRDQREAHVVLALERHLHKVEVTVQYHHHPLIGIGASTDLFTAIHSAVDRLEKQAIKLRAKWRDTKRVSRKTAVLEEEETRPEEPILETENERKVFRVNHHERRKPMTLEEALLEMEGDRDYLVYRDSVTDRVSVLVRRRDGNFALIEA